MPPRYFTTYDISQPAMTTSNLPIPNTSHLDEEGIIYTKCYYKKQPGNLQGKTTQDNLSEKFQLELFENFHVDCLV